MFEISHKKVIVSFEKISEETPSHGDTLFFGFFYSSAIKTYCYLAQSQITELQNQYSTSFNSKTVSIENKRSSWKSLKVAQSEKFILNIGLIICILEAKEYIAKTAKLNPVILTLFDDKRTIFHNIKNNSISYKNLINFRSGDFSFNLRHERQRTLDSVCYQIKDCKNLKDLSNFVFGFSSNDTVKNIINICIRSISKNNNDFELNVTKIRYIWFLRTVLSNEETYYYISNYEEQYSKTELYKEFLYLYKNEENLSGLKTLLSKFTDVFDKYKILRKCDIPNQVLKHFSNVMGQAFPVIKPRIDNIDSLTDFYNNLSRNYGRLHLQNFNWNFKPEYQEIQSYFNENKKFDNYQFVVPTDYHQTVMMGSDFQNCAGNFDQISHYKKVLPICILKNNKPILYMSINNFGMFGTINDYGKFNIGDLRGYKNSLPFKEDLVNIKNIFKLMESSLNIKVNFDNTKAKKE